MSKVVVAGYHGYENAGDDATLITIINSIKKCDENAKIVVLSKNPSLTKQEYDVNAINRFNPFFVGWHILTSNVLILGGGTLIQDSTSSRSNTYYLALIQMAKLFMKKVMLYSNGMGPLKLKKNIKKASKVLNKVDIITLRENFAKRFLDEIGVKKPQIVITADPAFNLKHLIKSDEGQIILKKENITTDKKIIGISIRETKDRENYINEIAKICDYIVEKYDVNVLFIPFQHAKDLKISNEIMNIMKNKAYVLTEKHSVEEILNVIANCYIIVGMRLHSIIFSALSNKPVLGISYDPKVDYYLKTLNADLLGNTKEINFEECISKIENCFKNYESIQKKLKEKVDVLIDNTKQNEKLLKTLLKTKK